MTIGVDHTWVKMVCLCSAALFLSSCSESSHAPIPTSEVNATSTVEDNPLAYLRMIDPSTSERYFEDNRQLFEYDQTAPLDVLEVSRRHDGGLEVAEITYESPKGGRVPATLFIPKGAGPFAGIVMMRSTELEFAMKYAKYGAVVLVVDPPSFRPNRKGSSGILTFTDQDRDEQIQLIIDLRRGIDLLSSMPQVDPERSAYIGVSYGGAMGGLLAGVEDRFQAYVLVIGDGGLVTHVTNPELRTMSLRDFSEKHNEWIQQMWPIEPIHFVSHASPVPLLLQNATQDQYVNVGDALRYQKVASEPKEVIWYDSTHWPLPEEAVEDNAKWLQQFIGPGELVLLPDPNYRASAVFFDRLILLCIPVVSTIIAILIWRLRRTIRPKSRNQLQ